MHNQSKSELISELEHSQVKIKQAEDKYRHLFNSLGDAIFVHDMNGKILDANEHACKRYGYSYEKFITMQVKDVDIPDHAKHIDKRVEILIENGNVVFESFHRDSQGLQFPVEVTARFGEYDGQKLIMVICHDISERKKAEEEQQKIKKLESVGILAGGIAHDFNNILTGILGNIELAEKSSDKGSDIYMYLNEARNASIRAKDLTQQLLTFSKGGDPVRKTSSIGCVITDSANFVLHGSSVKCRFDIPEDLWKVDFDKGQISQVIQNIIINARQAMPDGGIINVSCKNITNIKEEVLTLPEQKYIRITITDSGPGIPTKYIDKIFDPYFTTREDGSGLGLAICNSIIMKHDGYISVQSEENKGATFLIYLPASLREDEKSITDKQDLDNVINKATIMVMDDESIIRNMTKQMLELFGHEVLLTENGFEAINIYREYFENNRAIDIIILDLTIPGGMGGKEAVLEILKINPKAKVVVSSGYSNDPVIARYSEYGFVAAIPKPFQIDEMNKIINEVLILR